MTVGLLFRRPRENACAGVRDAQIYCGAFIERRFLFSLYLVQCTLHTVPTTLERCTVPGSEMKKSSRPRL